MELISQHNHTNFTGHGQGSIFELVSAAREKKMSNIAITEHYPLSGAVDPTNFISMPWDRLDEYCNEVKSQQQRYDDIEILLGCELDYLGDSEDRDMTPADFDRFDIVLGSVHFEDGWAFDRSAEAGHWDEVGPDYIWDRYFELWCEAALSPWPFTVMSHPDLPKKFNRYPTHDLLQYYRDAAEAAREGNRMIEVNTSGLTYACKELYPASAMLREFCKAGVPCTIGTDAHEPCYVDRYLMEGYRYMYETGYHELTVVVPGGDRRTVSLE